MAQAQQTDPQHFCHLKIGGYYEAGVQELFSSSTVASQKGF
jgi:hypothetical protein